MFSRYPQPRLGSKLAILTVCFFAVSTPIQAQITGTFADATWTHNPAVTGIPGGHTVSAAAYHYHLERWELPVKASDWAFDGNPAATSGTLIHSGTPLSGVGEYHAYSDFSGATLTTTGTFWTINMAVKGDSKWIGSLGAPEAPEGLKGRYQVYFGQYGTGNHWMFNVNAGTALTPLFSTSGVKLYEDSTVPGETPPYGTAVDVTREESIAESNYKGYLHEVPTTNLTARTLYNPGAGIYQLEMRYDFATGPITAAILNSLDYLYLGTSVSNPSAPGDFFANDHFTRLGNTSPEYDTILVFNSIPEPSTLLLVGAAAIGFYGWRRCRRRSAPSASIGANRAFV